MPTQFVVNNSNYMYYALVHSTAFKKVNGENLENENNVDCIEGLVKISHGCKHVYRKMRGFTTEGFGIKGQCVCLDSRTCNMLKIKAIDKEEVGVATEENKVTIEPTNWFCYIWHHVDSAIKWPFRIAVVSVATTFFFSLLSLLMGSVSIIIGAISILLK